VTDRLQLLEDAVDLARAGGDATLAWFRRRDLAVDRKGDGTEVTIADRTAERLIREGLADRYPHDAILGEEEGATPGTSGRQWVIDPIDGTTSFVSGVPLFSTLVAVLEDGEPVVGVIHLPALGETVAAAKGLGCRANGRPCAVRPAAALPGSLLVTSGVGHWPDGALDRVHAAGLKVRTWGDAYGYALVATGRAEAMVDPEVNLWDLAPMPVVLAEAGGRFSALNGDTSPAAGSGLGSAGPHHDDLLALLRG
jgi:histidinol-phosphatase